MAIEIERKFLVIGDGWRHGSRAQLLRQGYVFSRPDRAVRVRLAGDQGFLTIKQGLDGASRLEFEYEIPPGDAAEMLDKLCDRPLVEKTRHTLEFAGREWTVDVFVGDNDGLILAEVELDREDQPIETPPWAGLEVTGAARYFNTSLAVRPYRQWTMAERVNQEPRSAAHP